MSASVKLSFLDFCILLCLPSNGVNAKIVLCDLVLLCEGQTFEILISLKL